VRLVQISPGYRWVLDKWFKKATEWPCQASQWPIFHAPTWIADQVRIQEAVPAQCG
jgi:hypothetical protein